MLCRLQGQPHLKIRSAAGVVHAEGRAAQAACMIQRYLGLAYHFDSTTWINGCKATERYRKWIRLDLGSSFGNALSHFVLSNRMFLWKRILPARSLRYPIQPGRRIKTNSFRSSQRSQVSSYWACNAAGARIVRGGWWWYKYAHVNKWCIRKNACMRCMRRNAEDFLELYYCCNCNDASFYIYFRRAVQIDRLYWMLMLCHLV